MGTSWVHETILTSTNKLQLHLGKSLVRNSSLLLLDKKQRVNTNQERTTIGISTLNSKVITWSIVNKGFVSNQIITHQAATVSQTILRLDWKISETEHKLAYAMSLPAAL